jgi:hypothetical protein
MFAVLTLFVFVDTGAHFGLDQRAGKFFLVSKNVVHVCTMVKIVLVFFTKLFFIASVPQDNLGWGLFGRRPTNIFGLLGLNRELGSKRELGLKRELGPKSELGLKR